MPEPLWQPQDPTLTHGRAPGPAAPVPPTDGRRVADAAATTVALVALLPLGLVATVVGLLTGMGIEGCGEQQTCRDVLGTGTAVVSIAPAVLWLLAVAGSIVLLVRGRRAWWVPLLAVGVWIALFATLVVLAETLQP